MSETGPQLTATSVGFKAEVISGAAAPGRPGALELKVRFIQGTPARGAAQLIEPSGEVGAITILGVSQVHYTHPSAIEANVIFIGVTGVALDAIRPGQIIVQPANGAT